MHYRKTKRDKAGDAFPLARNKKEHSHLRRTPSYKLANKKYSESLVAHMQKERKGEKSKFSVFKLCDGNKK